MTRKDISRSVEFAIQIYNAALDDAAQMVKSKPGGYSDGPEGSIEGQIFREIEALKIK